MKRFAATCVVLALFAASVQAQPTIADPEFSPMVPSMAASGGVGVADPTGLSSLFVNPAGLAEAPPTFTALGVSPTTYFLPTRQVRPLVGELSTDPSEALSGLVPTIASNGFGGNLTVGLGYTGNGIGLGLVEVTDVYADSTRANSQLADASSTLAFLVGLGVPITKNLYLGGTVRPMLRLHAPNVPLIDLANFANGGGGSSIPVLYGFGLGLDVGLLWNVKPFKVGLALRDIGGTQFYYSQASLQAVISSITSGKSLPYGTPVSSIYEIPMNATLGLSYHPELGKLASTIDPRFEVDYHYSFGQPTPYSPLLGLHAGADLQFFKFFDLRAGFDQGYFTFGAGFKALFMQVDAAYFTRPGSATNASALPNTGLAAGVTFSF